MSLHHEVGEREAEERHQQQPNRGHHCEEKKRSVKICKTADMYVKNLE